MSSLLVAGLLAAQACSGPFCGPDDVFEHPGDGLVGAAAAPVVALGADGSVLVAWELRSGGEPDIVCNRRGPGTQGAWLERPRRLDGGEWGVSRSLEPRIVADGTGGVWVVWQETQDGADDLRLARSTDDGLTWSADRRVGGGVRGATRSLASLARDGAGRLVVAWEDLRAGRRDLWMTRSSDGGDTWEAERRVDSDEAGSGVSYHPQVIAWEDGTLLVAWWDERDGLGDVYVRRTVAGGGAWAGAERRLDPGASGEAASHGVAAARAGDTVSLTWEETSGELAGRIVSRTSTDRGATWGEQQLVGIGEHPFLLARPDGRPIVGWAEPKLLSGTMTSVGGRIREIPVPVASNVSVPGGRVTPLLALEGLASQWCGQGGRRAWVARGGTAAGRAVLDVSWIDLDAPEIGPRRAVLLNYGEDLLRSADEVLARSLAGVVTPDGDLHLVWVNAWTDSGVLSYRAVRPR
jgi:hypothetical protein